MAFSFRISRSGIRAVACVPGSATSATVPVVNRPRRFSAASGYWKKFIENRALLRSSRSETETLIKKSQTVFPRARPGALPFSIADFGDKHIKLTRNFHGEPIIIDIKHGNDDEHEEAADDHIPMTITIHKLQGKTLKVKLLAAIDDIRVIAMSLGEENDEDEEGIEYPGPDFRELNEDDQICFMKYLDIRGINNASVKFLHKYMAAKDKVLFLYKFTGKKDKSVWIKELKQFIEA